MISDLTHVLGMARVRPGARAGFALPAVLAVTGIVTIVFLVAMTALYSLTSEAAAARARVRFLQRALTAEAVLSYMAATEPATARGIAPGASRMVVVDDDAPALDETANPAATQEVWFDGQPYRMDESGPLIVGLQDQAGMINLAVLTPDQAARLADRLGMSARLAQTLPDRIADFVDPDDLRQPAGAETRDYPTGSPPANRAFRRVDEWLSVLGVREGTSSRRWRALRGALAVDQTSVRFNANTASVPAMEILFGAGSQQAESVVRQRRTAPFVDGSAFAAALGAVQGRIDPDIPLLFPSGITFVTIRDGLSPWTYRFRLTLSPRDLERPLWIDQTDMLETPRSQAAETENVPRLPYTPH